MVNTKKRPFMAISRRSIGLTIFISIILVTGGYYLFTHHLVVPPQHQTARAPQPAKASVDGTQKTPEQKSSYTVPADHPKNLIIDSLGITANILPVGVLKSGALDAPKTAWDVGWYNQSALPGSGQDALLIDGHVNDAINQPGVFYHIDEFKAGDTLKIERGDGTLYSYQVVQVDQKPTEQVDMTKMLHSITPGKEGLNLITCGGTYDRGRKTYNDRILVYAVRVG